MKQNGAQYSMDMRAFQFYSLGTYPGGLDNSFQVLQKRYKVKKTDEDSDAGLTNLKRERRNRTKRPRVEVSEITPQLNKIAGGKHVNKGKKISSGQSNFIGQLRSQKIYVVYSPKAFKDLNSADLTESSELLEFELF